MSDEDRERIARLEEFKMNAEDALKEIRDDVKQLRADWTKARGLVAGVVLTVSAIWGVLLGAWQFIRHKVGS